mmetsp:Transcript_45958/g.127566  ORF Transcript_45958/g.127566 Transcript_45958/m.127566 type:complete len:374 (+) Transcript_45958:89-1210(+)
MDPQRRRLSVMRGIDSEEPDHTGKERTEQAIFECIMNTRRQAKGEVISVGSKTVISPTKDFFEKECTCLREDGNGAKQHEQGKVDAIMREMLERFRIGWCCKKGKKPESPNQDSFHVVFVENEYAIYSVFDGHGPKGHDVSQLARKVLIDAFVQHPDRRKDPGHAMEAAFTFTQSQIASKDEPAFMNSGSTCTLAYVDFERDTLTTAWIGDSRSVLAKRTEGRRLVFEETKDHKPNDPAEQQRIESANPPGRVVFDGFYNYRVFSQKGMYPGLNMSRAFGDILAHKEAGLTAAPDVSTFNLAALRAEHKELTLVVASDGVWEFLTSEDVFALVEEQPSPTACAEEIAKVSWEKWMADSDDEISDDITVIFVRL